MKKIYDEVFTNRQITAKRRSANHNKTVDFEKLEIESTLLKSFYLEKL